MYFIKESENNYTKEQKDFALKLEKAVDGASVLDIPQIKFVGKTTKIQTGENVISFMVAGGTSAKTFIKKACNDVGITNIARINIMRQGSVHYYDVDLK